uniref:Uncharacterized protein n=1 Tax=Strigamia maritima TaxID=126957 RepID=T1J2U5_STRMM
MADDFFSEYWDDYVHPKPGQISIVDALRWRDDVMFISPDRLSGLKPSLKKRIREDISQGNPPFSVLYEPPQKVMVSECDWVKDIPLPGENRMRLFSYRQMLDALDEIPLPLPQEEPEVYKLFNREPTRVFVYRNLENIDLDVIPLPQEEPEVYKLFNREPTRVFVCHNPENIDLNDISVPEENINLKDTTLSEETMGSKENYDSTLTSADSGYFEPIESPKTAISNFTNGTFPWCQPSTIQTFFRFESSTTSPQNDIINEPLKKPTENVTNNNSKIQTNYRKNRNIEYSDELYSSEREEGELSDSDESESPINFESKYGKTDLSLVSEVREDGELSDSDESESPINFESNYGKTDLRLVSEVREDGELSDSSDSVIEILSESSHSVMKMKCGNKNQQEFLNGDEIYLTDYEDEELDVSDKKDVLWGSGSIDMCSSSVINRDLMTLSTNDAIIDELVEFPCVKNNLSNTESDLALLIKKLESFDLGIDDGENATQKLVELMTELKLEVEKFQLPKVVIDMLEGLNLDPNREEESLLLAEKLAELTINLKKDLKMIIK